MRHQFIRRVAAVVDAVARFFGVNAFSGKRALELLLWTAVLFVRAVFTLLDAVADESFVHTSSVAEFELLRSTFRAADFVRMIAAFCLTITAPPGKSLKVDLEYLCFLFPVTSYLLRMYCL